MFTVQKTNVVPANGKELPREAFERRMSRLFERRREVGDELEKKPVVRLARVVALRPCGQSVS